MISTQHDANIDALTLEQDIINQVIKPIIPEELLTVKTRYLINPTGRFVEGGPAVDTGLTGQKKLLLILTEVGPLTVVVHFQAKTPLK